MSTQIELPQVYAHDVMARIRDIARQCWVIATEDNALYGTRDQRLERIAEEMRDAERYYREGQVILAHDPLAAESARRILGDARRVAKAYRAQEPIPDDLEF